MEKKIYLPIDAPIKEGDIFEGAATFDLDAALQDAKSMYQRLTEREKAKRHIYIGVYQVDARGNELAQDIYNLALLEGTWNPDHDVIELE